MFGYVIIDKPNILIKDYQTYRSYYCGLCKAIGKRTGQLMRFSLNYDIVLLALLAYNYEDKDPIFKTGHCPVHPVKKIEYVDDEEIFGKISDVNTILGYYKVNDDVVDEGKHKGIKACLKGYYKKAAKRLPDFAESVKTGYEKLREKEKKLEDAETIADVFGQMLMKSADAVTDKTDALLRRLLYNVGKWIYVIDAVDDVKKDYEKHNFNPFLREIKSWDDTVYDEVEQKARPILYECIASVRECYDKMHIEISEGALSNIIYMGLQTRTENVLKNRGQKCQKIRL